jgi:uncharacterized protein YjiS (DUF1127 family)
MMTALTARNTASKKHDRSLSAAPRVLQPATDGRRPDWLKPTAAEDDYDEPNWLEGLRDPRALEGLNQPAWRLLMSSLRAKIGIWRARIEQRRLLAQIDIRSLREAGIDPGMADFEATKPFWREPTRLRDLPTDHA